METCIHPLTRTRPHMWLYMHVCVFFYSVALKRSIVFLIPHLIILAHAFRSHGTLNTPPATAHAHTHTHPFTQLYLGFTVYPADRHPLPATPVLISTYRGSRSGSSWCTCERPLIWLPDVFVPPHAASAAHMAATVSISERGT